MYQPVEGFKLGVSRAVHGYKPPVKGRYMGSTLVVVSVSACIYTSSSICIPSHALAEALTWDKGIKLIGLYVHITPPHPVVVIYDVR